MSKEEMSDELRSRHETEVQRGAVNEDLESDMMNDNQIYTDRIELGKRINQILDKGTVKEESLSRERKEALELYRKQMPIRNIEQAELRPWQEQLFTLVKKPTDREVIWIRGGRGNEGKTWFYVVLRSCSRCMSRLENQNGQRTACVNKTTAEYNRYIFVQRTESC